MKKIEQKKARLLRKEGYSINKICKELSVSKSSVSIWVRDVEISKKHLSLLRNSPHTREAVEKRRKTRLKNEEVKRDYIINSAKKSIPHISNENLWLMGVMLYWAEGGKTQRLVRFSNGDPEMIKIMMKFFREICDVPDEKFRGYIHIHPHLNHKSAELYWSKVSQIPLHQFFKTYRKKNKSSQSKKNSLPNGVFDIYVMDTKLFYKIKGWAQGIFSSY